MKQNSRCGVGNGSCGVSQYGSSCSAQARSGCNSCSSQARNGCGLCSAFRARPWNECDSSCGAFRARAWNECGSCGRCGGPSVARSLCRGSCGGQALSCPLQRSTDCGCEQSSGAGRSRDNDCEREVDCDHDHRSLAMVYSEKQHFSSLYDPKEGLCRGTVFQELNKPFLAYGRK